MNDQGKQDIGSFAVHISSCMHWSGAEATPNATTFDSQTVADYADQIQPIYEQLKSVLGQIGGLLILYQTAPTRADRDQPMVTTAREQHKEIRDAINVIRPPRAAMRHYVAVGEITTYLGSILDALNYRIDLLTPDSHDLDVILRQLFAAHRLLLAVSDDRAGMTPVDFSNACCSCGAADTPGQPYDSASAF